nr:TPA_asm: ATP synthase F0 subunit 8 [Tetraponera aethiops]
MPQMSPILWVPALMLFLILIYLVISFNHYYSLKKKLKNFRKKNHKILSSKKKWTFKL